MTPQNDCCTLMIPLNRPGTGQPNISMINESILLQ
jgi:hypothetical protein